MNIERLKQLRDHIEAKPHTFDMANWGEYHHPREKGGHIDTTTICGTVGCIAGTAVFMFEKNLTQQRYDPSVDGQILHRASERAARLLDLHEAIEAHLFQPNIWMADLLGRTFRLRHQSYWGDNFRCDLDTVEKMEEWAAKQRRRSHDDFLKASDKIYQSIGPTRAVRCLDNLIEDPTHVNWFKAIQPKEWEKV